MLGGPAVMDSDCDNCKITVKKNMEKEESSMTGGTSKEMGWDMM